MKTHRLIFVYTFIISGIFGCQTNNEPAPINLQELTIQNIHKAFKDGEYNSQKLVSAYLERIQELDPTINAINAINPNALAIAKELDDEYQRTKVLRPLHGIPVIVKNNIQTKGLETTAGAFALQNFMPDNDAFIVSKLVDAGAIILAKSNMAEWAFTPWGSYSSTNGATLNAYNQEYSSAGSSGGTGASIASNFGVIGLGTDTGGSVRLPSSHGSLVGFRPTMGLVSRAGIVPCELRQDMAGPMCRTVEDATRVLEVISGYDEGDELTKYSKGKVTDNYTQFLKKDGLNGSRIGVLREIIETEIDPEILELFEKSIEDMKKLGAEIIDSVNIPNFSSLRKNHWCSDFKTDIENYLITHVQNDTISSLDDIIRIGSKSTFTEGRLNFYTTNSGRPVNPEVECLDAYSDELRIAFRDAIENYMDSLNLDALIYPTWNIKPYRMDSIVEKYIGDNTGAVAPHTGQPAFTVPMGFMKDNLPTGVEFLGRMYSEPTLIKLTYSYEQGTKHRRTPKLEKGYNKK